MEAELTTYADVVAHDLSAPLAGIAMLVKVLELRPDAAAGARRAAGAAGDLRPRRASWWTACSTTHAPASSSSRPSPSSDVTDAVAADLRPQLAESGGTLVVGDLPEVRADPRQLRRVVQNLVGNALKFRGEDPPRVEIGAERGRDEWIVSVSDNGIGIDRENARRIFAMFSRVERRVEGSGIGLAVCRRVVESHGGRIWVEPVVGGGSAFTFTLPFGD